MAHSIRLEKLYHIGQQNNILLFVSDYLKAPSYLALCMQVCDYLMHTLQEILQKPTSLCIIKNLF